MARILDISKREKNSAPKDKFGEKRIAVSEEAEEKEQNLWQAPEESEEPTQRNPLFNCLLSIILLALIAVFLYLLFPDLVKISGNKIFAILSPNKNNSSSQKTDATLPAENKIAEETTTISATTTTAISLQTNFTKETVKIKVVNGRGMQKAATTIKAILEKNGYKNIETGDLNELYRETYVYYKDENGKSWAEDIEKILSANRNVKLEKSDKTGKFDILVVGGLS